MFNRDNEMVFQIKEHVFEIVKDRSRFKIPASVLHNVRSADIQIFLDGILREMIAEIDIRVARRTDTVECVEETIEVPATWWDHFKQSCCPSWFTDWYPVKSRKIFVSKKTVLTKYCPHIKLGERDETHIRWLEAGAPNVRHRG